MLSPLDCLPAKAGGAVNGCAYAPFILTVDWLGWVCYLPDKLEFSFPYLDLIIALTNYDEICESEEGWYHQIELGIWIHSDTIEFILSYHVLPS